MKIFFLALCFLLSAGALKAQYILTITVKDADNHKPLPGIAVTAGQSTTVFTDSSGTAAISARAGSLPLQCYGAGYASYSRYIHLPDTLRYEILLETDAARDLEEVTIVASTRTNQPIENSPLKIEVLGKEELSEEAGIKPGNIASILGDVSGVQIQQSSASSGNSNIRIQGLDGRYTQVLRDGMPMYDGFSGGLGILTIPPLDLQQIELIKGSASTLYGGGAIGGLVNLLSRKPTMKQEADILVNMTTLKEYNLNAFAAKRNKKTGYTFFAGYTLQKATDVNTDGFSDVPDVNSIILHPRLFFYPDDKTILSIGYNGSFDQRKGGDMQVLRGNADSTHRYFEQNKTDRHGGEYSLDHFFTGNTRLTLKGTVSSYARTQNTNSYDFKGRQTSYYNELSVFRPMGNNSLVAGINITGDRFTTQAPDTAALRKSDNTTAGVFAQYSLHLQAGTTAEAGLRADIHNRYGLFLLPRLAVFHRFHTHWGVRAGFGMGYKTPNPLVQQTIEYALPDLLPVADSVLPEISYGYNAELNYKTEWDKDHSLFINQALFFTQLQRPIVFNTGPDNKIYLSNADKPIQSAGFDTYVKLQLHTWELYLGYTYTDVQRTYLSSNRFMPLTPRHRLAFVLVKEIPEKWRFGLEGSYTGSQYRYDATATPGYLFLAAMVQRNIGDHILLVLNGENLLDYRMSRNEPLYTGSSSNPLFKPLWAPIDGRVINLSLRWKL